MQDYKDWTLAAELLAKVRYEVFDAEGTSPAWDKVRRARDYALAQAEITFQELIG